MATPVLASLLTLAGGVILWALGYYAQKKNWIFNRRTEDNKLQADRIKQLEEENTKLEALVHVLRLEIINDKIKNIGGVEITASQHRLLTCTAEELHEFSIREITK